VTYLLDTHAVLWFFSGNALLSRTVRNIITNQDCKKLVSVASVWETAIKISIGKLVFPHNTEGFVEQIRKNGFELLPITPRHIMHLEQLPLLHRDPFDRLLISAAIIENITLLTNDADIQQYPVRTFW
jgi:PIN domain nuclease of toxin-antitoxin system